MPPQRWIRSVLSNWARMFWGMGWALVMVPLYIRFLGKDEYGIWILINAVVGYYGLLDVGVHAAVVRGVARALGQESVEELNRTFNTALMIQTLAGAVALVVSLVVAFLVPSIPGFILSEHPQSTGLLLLVGAASAVTFPGSVFRGALNAAGRFDVSNLIRMLFLGILNVSQLVVLSRGGGMLEMAAVLLAVTVVEKPVMALAAIRLVPDLRLGWQSVRRSHVPGLLGYGVHALAVSAGERLRFLTDSIVIGAHLPATEITAFRIGSRPMEFLATGTRGISHVLVPAFSRTEAGQAEAGVGRLLVRSARVTMILAIWGCLLLAAAGDRLIELWLGPGFETSVTVLMILLPAYLFETGLAPAASSLLGTRGYRWISAANVLEGISNLVLSLILVRSMGLIGVALGTAIPMLINRLGVLPVLATRAASVSVVDFFRSVCVPVLPGLVVGGASAWALHQALRPSTGILPALVIVGLVSVAYLGVVLGTLWLRDDPLLTSVGNRLRALRS